MQNLLPPPYPLVWPHAQRRSARRERSRFQTKLPGAIKNVETSLRMFAQESGSAIQGVVVSTNTTMFETKPEDPGVAVWLLWDGATRCIAVDRYLTVAENLQAIHHVLEARRVELRHAGIEMARTAFKGFLALPPPPDKKPWHEVLNVPADASVERINAARKELARECAGDEARMYEINTAHADAMAERTAK